MAALAAGLISRSTGTATGRDRSIGKSPTLAAPYGKITTKQELLAQLDRDDWNDKVDAKKREKNITFGRRKERAPKKRMLPAPSNRGATIIGDLIFNYQVHSNNIMNEFTCQRAKEYMRRVGGRSIDGVKAEAEHLHRARNKHQKKVSRMIGGRTLRVILQLSNLQQYKADVDRTRQWQLWEPIANGIWQYQVHDEVFPYYMFNDETGNLYEFDPARLHFSSVEDCNQAMHLYVDYINAKTQEEKDATEVAFKEFCETHGHTLTAATNTISADEAGDENYALEG
ncbi:hypothetical protein SOP91_00095 (plasmid) [Enterobacter hormaechei]|uniref:hypothetical protein n=1 Tax=Enterobacter hormaechei TaxID=158836 RepID=UPI002B4C087C|nr:hypothetical protein [Enterobacter hormaechei]WRM07110.1 hypothetical protein SOP91_00095 [Enterobacter hormaechei]